MSHITAFMHLTWSTKNRIPYLHSEAIRALVWKHIEENALAIGLHLSAVSGYTDHCHCLVSLDSKTKISDVARRLKGESSRWINQQNLLKEHFTWQQEYYAAAVSLSHFHRVKNYILNQEQHHNERPDDEDFRFRNP